MANRSFPSLREDGEGAPIRSLAPSRPLSSGGLGARSKGHASHKMNHVCLSRILRDDIANHSVVAI